MRVPHPVGVVEDACSLHRAAQPIGVGEVQGGHLHPAAEGALRIRAAGQCPDAHALVKRTPGHIPACVAEGAGDDGEVGVRHHAPLLTKVGGHPLRHLQTAPVMVTPH